MTEKLTIDQKIQIAQIAGDIVSATMSKGMQNLPVGNGFRNESDLLKHFYNTILATVTNEPEQN